MTEKSTELVDRVRQEIDKTGFPLELRAGHALLSRRYHVAHNVYYLVSRPCDSRHNSRAGHPVWRRCSSLTYVQ